MDKEQREKMIDELIGHDVEQIDEAVLADILREGCQGYESMTDEEIEECHYNAFGED